MSLPAQLDSGIRVQAVVFAASGEDVLQGTACRPNALVKACLPGDWTGGCVPATGLSCFRPTCWMRPRDPWTRATHLGMACRPSAQRPALRLVATATNTLAASQLLGPATSRSGSRLLMRVG